MKKRPSYRLLFLPSLLCLVADAFVGKNRPFSSWVSHSPASKTTPDSTAQQHTRFSSTVLTAKLWDRLELEEDPEPFWYLLNCVAGLEIDLLRQCRSICQDMPDAIRFVVPTERKTRSHGAIRMVTEAKVKYPGYVFAKLRLCPEVYEAIQGLDLMRSWMGTVNRKGYKQLPPVPVALSDVEVENFGLEEAMEDDDEEENDVMEQALGQETVIVDSVEEEAAAAAKKLVSEKDMKVYQGLKVDDMVKVTKKGQLLGEDGVVRRLKDGEIFVRFYTYGTLYEEWMKPGDVRKLSSMEILKGLSGPSKPITQEDFDGPVQGRDGRRDDGNVRTAFRSALGATQQRNRRQDRTADQFKSRDIFGRTDDDKAREEKNWKWYQDQQRQGSNAQVASDTDGRKFRAGSRPDQRTNNSDWAIGDADSQWGRQPQRQQGRERNRFDNRRAEAAVSGKDDWSSFVSSSGGVKASPSPSKTGTDDFFDSLVADLSNDLNDSSPRGNAASTTRGTSAEDDFFATLMSDFNDATRDDKPARSPSPVKRTRKQAPVASQDDDFFASLEQQLEEVNSSPAPRPAVDNDRDSMDDFFAQLESELSPDFSGPNIDDSSGTPEQPKIVQAHERPPTKNKSNTLTTASKDLAGLTVPALKEMLKERGLKVSGKKSELIERLSSS